MTSRFICPIDALPLEDDGRSLRCEHGHVYDKAAAGYVNLMPPGKKNNAVSGDNAEMVRARADFLALGCYSGIADAVCGLADGRAFIIDAGCGEGYYTNRVARHVGAAAGLDASKHAAARAARSARASGISNVSYAAANIFAMPLPDNCADAVVSLFAPLPDSECLRVLKQNGIIILVAAGTRHLFELKSAVYGTPRENDPHPDTPDGFTLTERRTVEYPAHIPDNAAIKNLFSMTPYSYRTSQTDAAKLDGIDSLDVTVHTEAFIYTKN